MPRTVIAEWEGREYEHTPRSADWYWVLGIIAAAGAIAAVLFESYLLALLIVVAAAAVALRAAKEPPVHRFTLVEDGLLIGEEMHPFRKMHSFSVFESIDGSLPPELSIKNDSWFTPHFVIPLADVDVDLVYDHFLKHVDEDEHKPTVVDLVAAWLGF